MGRPELGTKRACAECHERFYDLNRLPAICPKCGAQQPAEKPRVSRPPRTPVTGFQRSRQRAEVNGDAAEAAAAPDIEAGEDAAEIDEEADDVADLGDEVDDDVELDPDRPPTVD